MNDFAERYPANCPSRVLLEHVTNKWGTLVLLVLSEGTLRWSELLRSIDGISEKMLGQTLRTLADDGFVRREVRDVVPPHVEYSLTDNGRAIAALLGPLANWMSDYVEAAPVA